MNIQWTLAGKVYSYIHSSHGDISLESNDKIERLQVQWTEVMIVMQSENTFLLNNFIGKQDKWMASPKRIYFFMRKEYIESFHRNNNRQMCIKAKSRKEFSLLRFNLPLWIMWNFYKNINSVTVRSFFFHSF